MNKTMNKNKNKQADTTELLRIIKIIQMISPRESTAI